MGIGIALHVLEPMSNLFLTVSDQQPRRQVRLRLSDLGWEQVPSDIADWTQVASIDLTSNPLECDCKLAFLRDLLSDTLNDTDEQSYVFCQHPQSLQGQPLQVFKTLNDLFFLFIRNECRDIQNTPHFSFSIVYTLFQRFIFGPNIFRYLDFDLKWILT